MNANDPLIGDDVQTDEERLEQERLLRKSGIKPGELTETDKDDLIDDLRSDNNHIEDTDDELSDVVPPEEVDGND